MAPLTLIEDSGNMATFAADFFPPDFSQWQDYLGEMAVTLQIAVWGTALAVVLSIPFGLMCADNQYGEQNGPAQQREPATFGRGDGDGLHV